jgi:hypothetical protein
MLNSTPPTGDENTQETPTAHPTANISERLDSLI